MFKKRIINQLNANERVATTIIFFLFLVSVLMDLAQDDFSTITFSEVWIEIVIVFLALLGFFILWAKVGEQKSLTKEIVDQNTHLNSELEKWRSVSAQFAENFQAFIDSHFNNWGLSNSEKDIAMFLLKGLDFKSIANIRGTSSSTVRNQAHSVYAKSNLTSRNDLAAFFMEELFHDFNPKS